MNCSLRAQKSNAVEACWTSCYSGKKVNKDEQSNFLQIYEELNVMTSKMWGQIRKSRNL